MTFASSIRFTSASGGPPRPPSAATPGGELTQAQLDRSVLVIEDEAMIAWMLESLLGDMGFTTVRIAANSAVAIALAEEIEPTLIVSDINLGAGEDGIDASARIAKRFPVGVVFVTGYADAETRARIAQSLPGSRVIRKPVHAEQLRREIIEVLRDPSLH